MKYPLILGWLGYSFVQVLMIGSSVWLWKELATCQYASNLVYLALHELECSIQ